MNILTQAALTAISDTWVRVADLVDTGGCTALQGADLWALVANTCEAFSMQHRYAQLMDESNTYTWLQDIAEHRAAMAREAGIIKSPKLGLVSAIGTPLK